MARTKDEYRNSQEHVGDWLSSNLGMAMTLGSFLVILGLGFFMSFVG